MIYFRISLVILVGMALSLISCQWSSSTTSLAYKLSPASLAMQVLRQYGQDLTQLDSAVARLRHAVATGQQAERQRQAFLAARRAWKRVELLAEYYSPSTAKLLNGPALGEVEEFDQQQRVHAPEGLQVLETYFYPALYKPAQREEVLEQVAFVQSSLLGLHHAAETLSPTDRHLFDAARLEVFRVMTLGIPGFDTPASPGAVPEAAEALAAVQATIAPYQPQLRTRHPSLAVRLDSTFRAVQAYLGHSSAAHFDRLEFLVAYANPLSQQLWAMQQTLGIPAFKEVRALRPDAGSLFEVGAFDAVGFAPTSTVRPTVAQAALGRQLFFDPVLSGNGSRSCASCHQPTRAFTDGQAKSVAYGGRGVVLRNAPTLLNAALQRTQFYDGRVSFLEDQVASVVASPVEMHGSLATAARLLSRNSSYRAAFAQAFATEPQQTAVQEQHVKTVLAAYLRSLIRLDAPLDKYMRGQREALSPSARRGANVFLGKAKCATCHFLPLFNGTVPPGFERTEAEVLGTPARASRRPRSLDSDLGRGGATGIRWQEHAFKTPSLRNIALTAPYMHQGAYRTLEEVIDFYDQGGGAGLGLDVPNQTLPADKLHLTTQEKHDLVSFLHALTDTAGLGHSAPRRLPQFPSAMARLNYRKVGGHY
ncbi:cytochrome c peroxidase [Hymenobacter gelipurpurascens]|uniref:Cytochrome c peroxidase n=2 Tax=Hymenobacter gelipurpurascens TaxID=89968 RepID=A0A212T745_9BACT|nr:cytochrome c peroxidase [Hymenobacter gelipurpurascens]